MVRMFYATNHEEKRRRRQTKMETEKYKMKKREGEIRR